jgi:hypothetical protein
MHLPAWHEEDAILALVEDELREDGGPLEQWFELQGIIHEGIFGEPSNEEILEQAFLKTRSGQIRQFADLLRSEHQLNEECTKPIRAELNDEMWEFLADVLEGIRNPRNDRAQDDFDAMTYILKRNYSKQSRRDIRHRALKFAAARHKVDQDDLRTHIVRSKKRKKKMRWM